MAVEHRVVIDTSTLLGAVLRKTSTPNQVLLWMLDHCKIYVSDATLSELAEVLQRTKFDKYVPLANRMSFLESYASKAIVVAPFIAVTDCRDPKDNKFLELALHIQAQVIVSSDDDLLALDPWRGIRILNPSGLMAWVYGLG
jgi:uncharacterized protein